MLDLLYARGITRGDLLDEVCKVEKLDRLWILSSTANKKLDVEYFKTDKQSKSDGRKIPGLGIV